MTGSGAQRRRIPVTQSEAKSLCYPPPRNERFFSRHRLTLNDRGIQLQPPATSYNSVTSRQAGSSSAHDAYTHPKLKILEPFQAQARIAPWYCLPAVREWNHRSDERRLSIGGPLMSLPNKLLSAVGLLFAQRRNHRSLLNRDVLLTRDIQLLEDRTLLASFTVDTVLDLPAANPATSELTSDGSVSLRSAIQRANVTAESDTIQFAASTNGIPIKLTIAGIGENAAATGDLDIIDADGTTQTDLTILGNSAAETVIDANALDRAFHVQNLATAVFERLTIRGGLLTAANSAGDGAAILSAGRIEVRDSIVRDNAAGYRAGGIQIDVGVSAGTSVIENTTISSNTSTASGSGLVVLDGVVEILKSTFTDNVAGGAGTIANAADTTHITISNTTISGNHAATGGGGGIVGFNGTIDIQHSTIVNNTAGAVAGGIAYRNGAISLISTIVAGNTLTTGGNTAAEIGKLNNSTGSLLASHNLIGDAATSGGITNGVNNNIVGSDPLLGPLAFYGGPTKTHSLLDGSPAIDKGTATTVFSIEDQRGAGFFRVEDDAAIANASGGNGSDIGAYERQISTFTRDYGDAPDAANGTGFQNYNTRSTDLGPSHTCLLYTSDAADE